MTASWQPGVDAHARSVRAPRRPARGDGATGVPRLGECEPDDREPDDRGLERRALRGRRRGECTRCGHCAKLIA